MRRLFNGAILRRLFVKLLPLFCFLVSLMLQGKGCIGKEKPKDDIERLAQIVEDNTGGSKNFKKNMKRDSTCRRKLRLQGCRHKGDPSSSPKQFPKNKERRALRSSDDEAPLSPTIAPSYAPILFSLGHHNPRPQIPIAPLDAD